MFGVLNHGRTSRVERSGRVFLAGTRAVTVRENAVLENAVLESMGQLDRQPVNVQGLNERPWNGRESHLSITAEPFRNPSRVGLSTDLRANLFRFLSAGDQPLASPRAITTSVGQGRGGR